MSMAAAVPSRGIAIVGAGLAGLAGAQVLADAGRPVILFDKGRRPGGRLSSRVLDTALGPAAADHGAPCFTARDADFVRQVTRWHEAGLVTPWPAVPGAWVGVPAMSAPLADMAGRLDVRWSSRVERLERRNGAWSIDGERFDEPGFTALAVAVPAEQAALLVAQHDPGLAAQAAQRRSAPCWTLVAAFAERLPGGRDVLPASADIFWAARDSAKPGRGSSQAEVWVVHASATWSTAHLEHEAGAVAAELLAVLAREVGAPLPIPLALLAHRWRYARALESGSGVSLWNPALGLGLCGDWLLGPEVEDAWLSGTRLARRMLASDAPCG